MLVIIATTLYLKPYLNYKYKLELNKKYENSNVLRNHVNMYDSMVNKDERM